MDRGVWQAPVHAGSKIGHDLVIRTKLFCLHVFFFVCVCPKCRVGSKFNSNVKQYDTLHERTKEEHYKTISIDAESPLQINILF